MEMLDYYDEYLKFLGTADREMVHAEGLWHKTIHCWLYDEEGNVYFQIRANSGKFYTTASGHVLAGENIDQAFKREIKEELGVDIEFEKSKMIKIDVWTMDKMKNGKLFKDRAFAHVYSNKIENNFSGFKFDENEVLGLIKINAQQCLNLLRNENELEMIEAVKISNSGQENIKVNYKDFLVQNNEIAIVKYGEILFNIIKLINA